MRRFDTTIYLAYWRLNRGVFRQFFADKKMMMVNCLILWIIKALVKDQKALYISAKCRQPEPST